MLVARKVNYHSPSTCLRMMSAAVDGRMNQRKAEQRCRLHRRSREVATKMMYSEESWLTTRPDRSVRRVVGTMTKCAVVAPQARIAALSGRELSPDREVMIDRIATLYTLCTMADQRRRAQSATTILQRVGGFCYRLRLACKKIYINIHHQV